MTYGHQNLDKYLLARTKYPHQMGLPLPHGCEHSTLPARQPCSTKTHFMVLRNKCSSTGHPSTLQGAPVTHAAACQRLKRCYSHSSERRHTAALCTHTHTCPSWKFATPLSCPAGGQGLAHEDASAHHHYPPIHFSQHVPAA